MSYGIEYPVCFASLPQPSHLLVKINPIPAEPSTEPLQLTKMWQKPAGNNVGFDHQHKSPWRFLPDLPWFGDSQHFETTNHDFNLTFLWIALQPSCPSQPESSQGPSLPWIIPYCSVGHGSGDSVTALQASLLHFLLNMILKKTCPNPELDFKGKDGIQQPMELITTNRLQMEI